MALSTQPSSSSMASVSQNQVVIVWEWHDQGHWMPYDSPVSNYIEKHFVVQSIHVYLGSMEPSLSNYVVDLSTSIQIRQDTGNKRQIRRKTYPCDSPAGRNISWQWAGDHTNHWCNYGLEIAQVLEDAFCQSVQIIDLSQTVFRLPYTIDFHKMQQRRNETGFLRQIRRIKQVAVPYDRSNSSGPSQTGFFSSTTANAFSSGATAFSNAFAIAGPSYSQQPQNYNSLVGKTKTKHDTKAAYMQNSPKKITRSHIRSLAPHASNTVTPQVSAPPATHMNGVPMNGGPLTMNGGPLQMNGGPMPIMPAYLSQNTNSTLNLSRSAGYNGSGSNMRGITNMLISPAVPLVLPPVPPASSSQSTMPNYGVFVLQEQQESGRNPEEALQRFTKIVSNPSKDEDCSICFDNLQEPSSYADDQSNPADKHVIWKLNKCEHMFHKLCILTMYKSGSKGDGLQCPSCKTIYGEKQGNCPAGHMEYQMMSNSLPGHSDCGTIRITYSIYPGLMGPNHPTPGQPYSTYGFPRVCFLPNSEIGRKILRLLVTAWQRRLTFTVGTSATTGMQNTVIWNEIHHKTEFGSNNSGHGYPDPKYFDNVLLELASHGVTEDS